MESVHALWNNSEVNSRHVDLISCITSLTLFALRCTLIKNILCLPNLEQLPDKPWWICCFYFRQHLNFGKSTFFAASCKYYKYWLKASDIRWRLMTMLLISTRWGWMNVYSRFVYIIYLDSRSVDCFDILT